MSISVSAMVARIRIGGRSVVGSKVAKFGQLASVWVLWRGSGTRKDQECQESSGELGGN